MIQSTHIVALSTLKRSVAQVIRHDRVVAFEIGRGQWRRRHTAKGAHETRLLWTTTSRDGLLYVEGGLIDFFFNDLKNRNRARHAGGGVRGNAVYLALWFRDADHPTGFLAWLASLLG